jgi:hypothetical protein
MNSPHHGQAEPMPEPTRPLPRARYWLGCYRCGHGIWLDSPKPRRALCDECRSAA